MQRGCSAVGFILLAALCGCGGKGVYPVSGKVVFAGSDEPARELAGYLITLEAEEKPISARAQVKEDGTFVLGTHGEDDGALLGKHKVVIKAPLPASEKTRPVSLIDGRYATFASTDLVIVVEAKRNDVTLTVERRKKK